MRKDNENCNQTNRVTLQPLCLFLLLCCFLLRNFLRWSRLLRFLSPFLRSSENGIVCGAFETLHERIELRMYGTELLLDSANAWILLCWLWCRALVVVATLLVGVACWPCIVAYEAVLAEHGLLAVRAEWDLACCMALAAGRLERLCLLAKRTCLGTASGATKAWTGEASRPSVLAEFAFLKIVHEGYLGVVK